MYVSAAEEKSAGACCAGMRAEEVGPELAGSRGEEGNGVTEDGDGVRDRRRGLCFRRFIRSGSVTWEGKAVTYGSEEPCGH